MALHEIKERDVLRRSPDLQLRLALGRIGGGSGTLAFGPGTYEIKEAHRTRPSVAWWLAPGAVLDVLGKLTIQGPIFAPRQRIFATRISGGLATSRVTLDASRGQKIAEVLPEWWGAGADQGEGLQAMARSLTKAGRTLITFNGSAYRARPMTFSPGHRFVSPRGAEISATGRNPFLMEIVHEMEGEAPMTSMQGLRFIGQVPSTQDQAPEEDLVVVRSLRGGAVPLNLMSCAFVETSGAGLVIPSGAIVQANELGAERCRRAGLETTFRLSVPNLSRRLVPKTVTALQWSNRDSRVRFNADVRVGDQGAQTLVQMSDIDLGGSLNIMGSDASRVTLMRCEVDEALSMDAQGAQIIAYMSNFKGRRISDRGHFGARLQAPGVSLMSQCNFSFDFDKEAFTQRFMDRQEPSRPALSPSSPTPFPNQAGPSTDRTAGQLFGDPAPFPDFVKFAEDIPVPAFMTVEWETVLGVPVQGILLLASSAFVTPSGQATEDIACLRSVGTRKGLLPVLVLDNVDLRGTELGSEFVRRQHVLIQGASMMALRSVRLKNSLGDLSLNVSSAAAGAFFDALEIEGIPDGMCLQFQGEPMSLPLVLAAPMVGIERVSCLWGGRLLQQRGAMSPPLGAFQGDQIVVDDRPVLVCVRSGSRNSEWRPVESGLDARCSLPLGLSPRPIRP